MNRALFLDRDGILNFLVPLDEGLCAPRQWSHVKFCPGIEQISKMKRYGFVTILASNQPDVERGLVEKEFVEDLHEHYRKKLSLSGLYTCFSSAATDPRKKPNPGMLLEAAEAFSLDLSKSFFVGDTRKDMEAARNAGCASVLWNRPYNAHLESDFRVSSWDELERLLLNS